MSLHAVTLPALASAQPTMFGLRSNAGSAIPNSATGLAGHAAIAISHAVTLLATRASTALVAAIWEGFVLAACVALCLRLLPRIGAAARSLIWSAVLLLVLALPMLSLLPGVAHSVALGHAASSAAATTLHSLPLDDRWAFALAALWVCASLIRAVRLVRGAYRLRQIAQRATPVEVSPACATLLAEAPHRRLQGRPVQLCSSTDIDRPSVAGFFSPRILLPPSLLARLSATELEPILRHELEHLRRSDDWTNLLQKLALVLFPLNPVLLWVERRLCLERELACDDGVLRATRAPKAYATSLATLAEHALVRRGISLALAAWDRQSELARRVHRILGRPVPAMSRRTSGLVTGSLVAVMATGAFTLAHGPSLITFTEPASTTALASSRLLPVGFTALPTASYGMAHLNSGAHATLVSARVPYSTQRGISPMVREAYRSGSASLRRTSTNIRSSASPRNRVQHSGHSRELPTGETLTRRAATATTRRRAPALDRDAPLAAAHAVVTPSWVVLTSWTADAPAQHIDLNLSQTFDRDSNQSARFAYAAVPTPTGWILIEL